MGNNMKVPQGTKNKSIISYDLASSFTLDIYIYILHTNKILLYQRHYKPMLVAALFTRPKIGIN